MLAQIAPELPQPVAQHHNGLAEISDLAHKRGTAMLVQYINNEERLSWPLSQTNPITIGRDGSCAISLPYRKVSRHHARIAWFQDRYVIEDLGSTNGTFVNGEACRGPLSLIDGDEVEVGSCAKLHFLDEETTEPQILVKEGTGLRVEQDSRSFSIDGVLSEVPLSPPQLRMLQVLLDANGEVVSREKLVETVWPDESRYGISEQAIDAVIRRIRLRIAVLDPTHQYLVTVRGYGFRFVQRK